ncbi:MAG TPA: hypothetical protein PK089_05475 [Methanoregulaceae archaeon]|nr:hypothetical protein [Methanoregulaceae archaeon]HQJ87313.1 hypothetical protein [Methanoregulaceae archaeon]
MTEKAGIIAELGEQEILFPALVQQALVANDHVKYYFSLLQTARQRAEHPGQTPSTLRAEREAAGIEDPTLDGVVVGTVRTGEGRYAIPQLARILAGIRTSIETMIRPVQTAPGEGEVFEKRLNSFPFLEPGESRDEITTEEVSAITSGDRTMGDSPHLLVMDLHRALNELLSVLSNETVEGAQTYLLTEEDRDLVGAFMAGLHRTAHLKFGHPGLGTTATRVGERLLIQNDIGLTDAHVLVIAVGDLTVNITYTDVHMARLEFFQSLFEAHGIEWTDTLTRKSEKGAVRGAYHLAVGTFRAADRGSVRAILEEIGARVVFLIDWNRARKQLRNFLLNKDAIQVLRWAATEEVGHRGFLELGGERLVYTALDFGVRMPLRYGEPLHRILGREKTIEYLRWVLRTTSEGLSQGLPRMLIQDECRAELRRYFRSAQAELLEISLAHATLLFDVAEVLEASLSARRAGTGTERIGRNAVRAKQWEREADHLVSEVRTLSRRVEEVGYFVDLITAQDDALDALEEGCFYTTLISGTSSPVEIQRGLEELIALAVASAREFIRAVSAAQYAHTGSSRDEMQDFLAAKNRVIALEQECDEAWRRFERTLLIEQPDGPSLRVYAELSRTIEESTNALMKSVYVLHDNIFGEVRR